MTFQHKKLAGDKWSKLSFIEQMANIGSEVERTISWREKGNKLYSEKALGRSLELLDLTIVGIKNHRVKELRRVKEALTDYFVGNNKYNSSDKLWRKYFMAFNFLSRKNT